MPIAPVYYMYLLNTYNFLKFLLEKDGVTGIQRDCAIFPEGVSDGDCVKSLISGETCYCKGENCNAGDMDTTTTTPSPPAPPEQQHCYHCHPNEDCFADGDGNGDPVLCEEFEQGCYKEQMGNFSGQMSTTYFLI